MYEHNALGYWSGLALCLTKSEAVEHAVLRQLLYTIMVGIAYFVKLTPPRAFSVSFKFFVDLFQIYFRCA